MAATMTEAEWTAEVVALGERWDTVLFASREGSLTPKPWEEGETPNDYVVRVRYERACRQADRRNGS